MIFAPSIELCNDELVLNLPKLLITNVINEYIYKRVILAKYLVSQTNIYRYILGLFSS
jgi:hypothetical protein